MPAARSACSAAARLCCGVPAASIAVQPMSPEIIAKLLPYDATVGIGGIPLPPLDALDEQLGGRRQPQSNEIAARFARDRLNRRPLVGLGEDRIDDDSVPRRQRALRLVLEDGVDALRRTDAVVLTLEALRLGHAEKPLALNVAAQMQGARRRTDERREPGSKRRFTRA